MEFDHLANLIKNCFTVEGIVNLAMGQAAISETDPEIKNPTQVDI